MVPCHNVYILLGSSVFMECVTEAGFSNPLICRLGVWVWKSKYGGSKLKDKNNVTVSSLPDSFVDWTRHVQEEEGTLRATLLRQHLLAIPDYRAWLKTEFLED